MLCVTTACSTTDLAGSDRNLFLPTVRAAFDTRPPPPEGKTNYMRLDVEVAATGGTGKFDLDLLAGESITIGNTTFLGAQTLAVDFNLFEASVAARIGAQTGNVEILGIAGVAYNIFDADVTGRTAMDNFKDTGLGPVIGFQAGWEALRRVEFYTRGTYLIVPTDATSAQFEVGAGFAITKNMFLFGAYRWWRYRHELALTNFQDVDVRAGGFVLGLELRF